MTSRERVRKTLNYEQTDRVAVDMGSVWTGAHVSIVSKLKKALGLSGSDERTRVFDPYQMLGEVDNDLRAALGVDVACLPGPKNFFGFENNDWKPWTTFDGTEVWVPGKFNIIPESDGSILQYPQGDPTAAASAKMPQGGYYFDTIIRQQPIDEAKLDPQDNLEEFSILTNEDLQIYQKQADEVFTHTDFAISMCLPGTALGDVALVPAAWMRDPKGIRDIEEWYVSTLLRQDYIKEVFAGQVDIAIRNMELIYQAVGDKVQVVLVDGTDLASQQQLFCGPDGYRELYMPYAQKINGWIHENTKWKTMKHCCGACEPLIDGFIEAGYDILNPVQTSAAGMDPDVLVNKYGGRIVFWGGGVDTQKTLPFGTPEQVYEEVQKRIEIFSRKGGYVFNNIHNIQCNTPVENVLAMFEAVGDSQKVNNVREVS